MKRRSAAAKRAARDSPAPDDADAVSAGSGDDQEPQEAAQEQQTSPQARRGPGTATVTRERALYFATGQQATAKKPRTGGDAQNRESWPGYFNTARDLSENREAAQAARNEEMQRREREAEEGERPKWTPRRAPRKTVLTQHAVVPRLQDLALRCLARHIDVMPTLEYVDSTTRHRVARAVVELRLMKTEVLPLFMFPGVTEIDIPDCSGIDETTFVTVLKECLEAGLNLSILRLGLCGRCVSDSVIIDLGDALKSVELLQVQGCYRLSDVGCEALVRRCAPSLQEFEISCNQRITKQSIDYFGELQHLQALTLSECPQLDDASLEALLNMKSLSKLALTQMERISDDFVEKLAGSLSGLRDVSLARCTQLSDRAVRAILEGCRDLKVLDISDMDELTDECLEPVRILGHSLRRVSMRCCLGFTDLAIEHLAIGANKYLEILEMSSVAEATDAAIFALQEHCSDLHTLDISFCRLVSEDALGIYVDSAEKLRSLVLWGCTQITARFLTSHSRDELIVTGHPLLTGLTIRY